MLKQCWESTSVRSGAGTFWYEVHPWDSSNKLMIAGCNLETPSSEWVPRPTMTTSSCRPRRFWRSSMRPLVFLSASCDGIKGFQITEKIKEWLRLVIELYWALWISVPGVSIYWWLNRWLNPYRTQPFQEHMHFSILLSHQTPHRGRELVMFVSKYETPVIQSILM